MAQLFRTKRLFKSPYFPGILRAVSVALLGLGVYFLLAGSQNPTDNPSNVLMWLFWWPLFIVQYLLLGRFWCAVCPFGCLGDGLRAVCGLNLPVPNWVKKFGPLVIGFFLVLIVWAEEAFVIPSHPKATAILLLVVVGCVLAASAVFERRAWCRYMCPLGGMGVAYARVGMLQIRGNPDKCRTCNAAICYYGNSHVAGCPMNEFPRIKETNAYCIFCGNCVKSCPKDSAKVEFRLPSRELWLLRKPGLMEAILSVLLGGVISATQFQHAFPEVLDLLSRHFGYRTGFTFFFLAWQGLFLLGLTLASQAATLFNGVSVKMNFSVFSYAIIPLILGAHLAQGLHLFARGSTVLQWMAEQRYGLDLPLGMSPDATLVHAVQFLSLGVGFLLAMAAVRYAAGTFFSRQRKIWASITPFAATFTILCGLFVWILTRTPRENLAPLPQNADIGTPGLEPLWWFLGFVAAVIIAAKLCDPLIRRRQAKHMDQAEPARTLHLVVKNEASEIVTAERALTRLAQAAGIGVKPIFDACTALEELMTYALLRYLEYENQRAGAVESYGTRALARMLDGRRPDLELVFTVLPQAIIIEMAEDGPPDDPLAALGPDTDEGLASGSRADRQIYRLRKYMSSLSYDRRNGKNVLTVVCNFETGDDLKNLSRLR
ncbi:4Fe-4S binding protein [Desulfovibrio aminophilus]|uniref:4Fe-4S binding protein n=1 Tax=Desulfovibrio aminophilus TaxID=81425 RepID=UPI000429E6E1|nr:4Fe-4S binding protein [Desulfovibrio aminophilus]